MRVANYYRVSTQLQQEKFSLSAQKTELRSYLEKQKWVLVDEFTDVETGGRLDKAGLNALLDLVENGRVDAVLCMDQDRLSRLDTVSWEYLKSVLRENHVKIAEPNGTLTDLHNEDDEFISDLRNLMAQREKRGVVRRLMYGKRQRLREGKGWGQGPFEYEYDQNKGMYFIKPGWGWTIPLIDKLYLKEQLGMKSISDRLNEVSTTPTGRPWNGHLVHTRILSKSFHGVQEKKFSNGEVIATPGIFEPMRTEKTYQMLQEERKKRREQFSIAGRKNTDNIHMLKRSRLKCGICGRVIHIATHGSKEKPTYYARHGRRARLDGSVCYININSIRFDDNITKALKDILVSEEMAKKYIDLEFDEEEVNQLKSEIDKYEKANDRLSASLDRLLDLYLSGSSLSKESYLAKETEIKNKLEVNEKLMQQLKTKLNAIDTKSLTYENLYEYLEMAADFDKELTNLEKAQMIGTLFPNGILYEDELILITDSFQGIPLEVKIHIDPDPFPNHPSKR